MEKTVIKNATLLNIDCMEFMRTVPDKYFDLAVCDPPYFEGPNRSGYYGKGFSSLGVQRAKYYQECKSWAVPDREYFINLKRVSKNQIIWGANHFAGLFDSSSAGWIVWDKDNGKSSFADAELAYSSFHGAVRIFKYMWNGMHQGSFGGDVRKNDKRIHPTQKPVPLYEWLLTNYAKPGQKILDTHGGSMSSVIAANNMGFGITCCELDPDYFKTACERVSKYAQQERLFA
ncbi:site-specific DNA-methyltransferase (adenine-specific) [Nitrosomonas ureae]|uniref:site-specific DNA-methyltransferase (adenine-specific) n=1 Tax=Nitrosomonas ureae TaxID=44577 RepID=A0A1H2EPQ2_9PROT|nr:site-specific DNA-methyltransferase (adenine-specific) [Nitrosomonas ureae]